MYKEKKEKTLRDHSEKQPYPISLRTKRAACPVVDVVVGVVASPTRQEALLCLFSIISSPGLLLLLLLWIVGRLFTPNRT